MKSVNQNKGTTSTNKGKKNIKEREKRKSQTNNDINNHSSSEKGSPTKETCARLYAGIDSDSIIYYAEQTVAEHLSEEITNTLTEDINYRLRYIINESLIKARVSGRTAINSKDIEHTFESLNLDKVYGAPTHPNWIPFGDQGLTYLDDQIVNLVELAEEENVYSQFLEPLVTATWVPEPKEISKSLKNYFTTMCQMLVHKDAQVRRMALNNISENPRIGPIIEWFYNFAYILLSKDITYDCLTLRVLDLISILEASPNCRVNVSEKQLKLLVRLILQRLLKSTVGNEILRPICTTLAFLCIRDPLKQFVIVKMTQKFDQVFDSYALSIIMTANCVGLEAIQTLILPKIDLFLTRIIERRELSLISSILELYYILCKEKLITLTLYESFLQVFGDSLNIFSIKFSRSDLIVRKDLNFVNVKCHLLKTRRKISKSNKSQRIEIKSVFEMPPETSRIGKKIKEATWNPRKCDDVIIGKTSLLLPIFRRKNKPIGFCYDHTLNL